MIPEEHKEQIVESGIEFLNTIKEAYGSEEALVLWDQINSVLDPDIKGLILMRLLTGEYNGSITVKGFKGTDSIFRIKTLREISGLGLKEAKDLDDKVCYSKGNLTVVPKGLKRHQAITKLTDAGYLLK
jgi:hypothetical protein